MWLTVNNFGKLKCMIWFKKRFISQCFTLFWKVLQNILDLTWQQYTLTTNENVYCLLSFPTLAQGIQNICFYIYCHLLYDIKINCPFFLFMVLFRVFFFLALRSYHMIFWLCSHWWTSGIIVLNKFVLVARSGRDIVLNDHFLRLFAGVNWFHSSRIYCIALIFKVIQSLV